MTSTKSASLLWTDLIQRKKWSPLASFPPTQHLSEIVYAVGNGFYLLVNNDWGPKDPVGAVVWACSDYWAARIFDSVFNGTAVPPPELVVPPALVVLGRPKDLTYKSLHNFEATQPKASKATLVTASYRFPDGAFVAHELHGVDGVTYYFGTPNPLPTDLPMAILFSLKD